MWTADSSAADAAEDANNNDDGSWHGSGGGDSAVSTLYSWCSLLSNEFNDAVVLFSPLSYIFRAIYFACVNFFFFFFVGFYDHSENNYLGIRWTDFRNLFIERKSFGCRWSIWTSLSDIWRDVAIATNFVEKGKLPSFVANGISLPQCAH